MRIPCLLGAIAVLTMCGVSKATVPAIAVGNSHACVVNVLGRVLCWGDNRSAQLGWGAVTPYESTPGPVVGLPAIVAVGARATHSCALAANGTLYCWGGNQSGELGRDSITPYEAGVGAVGLQKIINFDIGQTHTCAVNSEGRVFCWGSNDRGQLGTGAATPFEAMPQEVAGVGNVVAVSLGEWHSCALSAGGLVHCWGDNLLGALGTGVTGGQFETPQLVAGLDKVTAIHAARHRTCARITDAGVSCWGNAGGNAQPSPVHVLEGSKLQALALADFHACALQSDDSLECWGTNREGQLGAGLVSDHEFPPVAVGGGPYLAVDVGPVHSCAIEQDGGVTCWGDATRGRLGGPVPVFESTMPVAVSDIDDALQQSVGDFHSCLRHADGTVSCWGSNQLGQLGLGFIGGDVAVPTKLPGLKSVTSVQSGRRHACALLADASAVCWGTAYEGALGAGTPPASAAPTPVNASGLDDAVGLAAGDRHTCAVRASGAIDCWGANDAGQLGRGFTGAPAFVPGQVPGITQAQQVHTRGAHSCALLADATVQCWGPNASGQLGRGTMTPFETSPAPVMGLAGVVALGVGDRHACAQTSVAGLDEIYCWGSDLFGQLGNGAVGDPQPAPVSVGSELMLLTVGDNGACARAATGVVCWGSNARGQLGNAIASPVDAPQPSPAFDEAETISMGLSHTCAMDASGTVACAGYGYEGQLGNGVLGYHSRPQSLGLTVLYPIFRDGFELPPASP